MFVSNEQQDGSKAFNVICDMLDEATYVPLHFNNLYSSKLRDKVVGIISTEIICDRCQMVL